MSPGRGRRARGRSACRAPFRSRRMRAISAATAAAHSSASAPVTTPSSARVRRRSPRSASAMPRVDGKPVLLVVLEVVGPARRSRPISAKRSLTNASSSGTARKLRAIVRRAAGAGTERRDERAGLLQHRDLGVAEAVDRLLAVADDEDRRLRDQPDALRPRPSPAARPAPTACGWCPGTRRRARGGSAPRAGSGSARTRPSAPSSSTARCSTSEKSSSDRSLSAVR